MPAIEKIADGDSQFTLGSNSSDDPSKLTAGYYVTSMNMVNRGGVLQTRPGYRWIFNLPRGNLQGMKMFTPLNSQGTQLIFAVDGKIYASQFPFEDYKQLPNLSFSPDADQVYWCVAEKAVTKNADGSLTLITPRSVLMIQDGLSKAGYWDGTTSGHLTAPNTTLQGKAMAFSGARLWVAQNEKIYASDIYDPFSFTEQTYLGGGSYLSLSQPVTGLAEVPSINAPVLLAFTDTSTTAIQSGILNRDDWIKTIGFQRTIFPNIGCVSHKSIVSHYGLLWWFTPFGLVSIDAAYQATQSSELSYRDYEMASSKAGMLANMSKIAGSSFENYLLMSVPHADLNNRHTWVMDNSVQDRLTAQSPPAWNGYWTGTRPVEWASGSVGGTNRIFHVSVDRDGNNRMWESFTSERMDQGCDITWSFLTREYNAGSIAKKEFRYAEFKLLELSGTVDLSVSWAGSSRGKFKHCLTKRIMAGKGSVRAGVQMGPGKNIFALKPQSRTVRTEDVRALTHNETLSSCGVESEDSENKDSGFQLCVHGSGPCAVKSVRLFFDPVKESDSGKCEEDELVESLVRYDGSSSKDITDFATPEATYTANKSVIAEWRGFSVIGSGTASSVISQQDANKKAEQIAYANADVKLRKAATPYFGGSLAPV